MYFIPKYVIIQDRLEEKSVILCYNKGLEPYLYDWDGSEAHLKSGATYSCANSGYYCTAMIKNNGWKIPKDYPLKLQY